MKNTALTNIELFSGVKETEISAMLNCLQAVTTEKEKHEFILRCGETTQNMGILLEGSALITQDDIWGNRNIISKLRPGESFAEPFAASNGIPLNIDVVADSKCELMLIPMNRILTTCSSSCEFHNRIIRNMVTILARKVLIFNDKITHVSKRATRDKVLSYLSSEARRQGKLSFDIPFDRQQLADYLCVERSALSVVLSEIMKEGMITYKKNHFTMIPESK